MSNFRRISIKQVSKRVLDVRLIDYDNIILKMVIPVDDKEKLRALFNALRDKGVSIPEREDGWWG